MQFTDLVLKSSVGERHDLILELSGTDSGHQQLHKAAAALTTAQRDELRQALASSSLTAAPARGAIVESLAGLSAGEWHQLADLLTTGSSGNSALARVVAGLSPGQRIDIEAELVRRGEIPAHEPAVPRPGMAVKPLICVRCHIPLVAAKMNFGYRCPKCGWQVPIVDPLAPEELRIERFKSGLLQKHAKVRIALAYSPVPFAEMDEDAWERCRAAQGPTFIARSAAPPSTGLPSNDIWSYQWRFWSSGDLDLTPEVVAVAVTAQQDWERRREEGETQRRQEDAEIARAEEKAKEDRRNAKLAWARAKLSGTETRRAPVPREVREAVFTRDGGLCVECGAAFDLQFDHIIPVAMGGATSIANLQLLCGDCNRRKGATLG